MDDRLGQIPDPFSFLIAAGESLRSAFATPIQRPALAAVMEQITLPFPQAASPAAVAYAGVAPAAASQSGNLLPPILLAVWLCGFLLVLFSWVRGWLKIRASVRASLRMTLQAEVPVLSSPLLMEPGIFGIIRPVLLLPKGINERLTTAQLGTIIAHEMCHVRRRDNLTASIHMMVEALFWFHPAVWSIRARLLEEREQACDEMVLQSGNEADLYAESILNVCKFCVESPLPCVAGVAGSDLKRRIVRIMTERVARNLDAGRKLLLVLAATVAISIPVVFGLVHIQQANARTSAGIQLRDIAGMFRLSRSMTGSSVPSRSSPFAGGSRYARGRVILRCRLRPVATPPRSPLSCLY
jgi:beta-lactamase regulating signal transducer with metallopeptidase domain